MTLCAGLFLLRQHSFVVDEINKLQYTKPHQTGINVLLDLGLAVRHHPQQPINREMQQHIGY